MNLISLYPMLPCPPDDRPERQINRVHLFGTYSPMMPRCSNYQVYNPFPPVVHLLPSLAPRRPFIRILPSTLTITFPDDTNFGVCSPTMTQQYMMMMMSDLTLCVKDAALCIMSHVCAVE